EGAVGGRGGAAGEAGEVGGDGLEHVARGVAGEPAHVTEHPLLPEPAAALAVRFRFGQSVGEETHHARAWPPREDTVPARRGGDAEWGAGCLQAGGAARLGNGQEGGGVAGRGLG